MRFRKLPVPVLKQLTTIETSKLPSGVYFYELNAESKSSGKSFTDTKKMVLIK
jgi:hypothetical protein